VELLVEHRDVPAPLMSDILAVEVERVLKNC
jgi:hypothetical protein